MAYKFFGSKYSTIVLTAATSFDGATALTSSATPSAQTDVTTFTGAMFGLISLHERALEITQISFKGTGTLTVAMVLAGVTTTIGTINANGFIFGSASGDKFFLPQSAVLSLSGASAGTVTFSARETDWN